MTAELRVAGIVGGTQQVMKSLSPVIHNVAFRALNMPWIYGAFPVEHGPADAIRGLAASGIRGLNVTMPHKVDAIEAMDELDEVASRAGAINTVQVDAGRLIGWNTDGEGLLRFLRLDLGFDPSGKSVLLVGAGGAARGAIVSLARAGARTITVAARDEVAAKNAASLAEGTETAALEFASTQTVAEHDLIINATPLGQAGETPPLALAAAGRSSLVVDMVYRPPITPLVERARANGATAHGGLGMLLHQACMSFEIWTGVAPPINVMSAAAVAELAGAGP